MTLPVTFQIPLVMLCFMLGPKVNGGKKLKKYNNTFEKILYTELNH